MNFVNIIWDLDDDPNGNVQHVAEHGLTPNEIEDVLLDPESDLSISPSSGRPAAFGFTASGRYIMVVYEIIDPETVYPVTAYEVQE